MHRYSTELVKLAEHSRSEAMLALAKQEAATAQHAYAAMARAEDANRAKDEFLSHISHELRTPLNAIIGFSEMIEAQLGSAAGDSKILGYVRDINSSGWHLNRVVNDLLDYGKFEAGKLKLLDEKVSFADIVTACVTMVKGRIEEKRLVFAQHIPEALPLLLADELKLRQIMINLLSNAVKFTPEGGRITLTAAVDPADGFIFEVRDTGIGIAPDDIPNVFLPFYQLDSKVTRKYEGTGLGLPLTKALVELHGGSICMTSATGAGTTVTVTFPAARVLTTDDATDDSEDPGANAPLAAATPTGKAA